MASSEALRRAVFLDRDGVLNDVVLKDGRPYPPPSAQDMRLLAGVEAACAALKAAGYLLIVVTNQPDIGRGLTKSTSVDAINDALRAALPLDDVRVCPHDDADDCACRKPRPGLLTAAARDFGIDIRASFLVGDRWRDIEAGRAAGCRTIFIDRNYDEKRPSGFDCRVGSLGEAVPFILDHQMPGDAT